MLVSFETDARPGPLSPHTGKRTCWDPSGEGGYPFDWVYSWGPEGKAVYIEWHTQLRTQVGWLTEVPIAWKCVIKASNASWWTWNSGSALFFWRWERGCWQRWAKDGQPHFLTGPFPTYTAPQRAFRSDTERLQVKAKVDKVRARMYVEPGHVVGVCPMFPVEKPPDDIRMVYDGSKSGLNKVLWAAHFGLPVVAYTLRSLMPGYFQCDMDVGEMFLNFWLNKFLRPYAGVNVGPVRTQGGPLPAWEESRTQNWERWCRNFMGLRDLPYRLIQLLTQIKYAAYGN